MGGGGFDIHYGIFRKPSDTVYEASKATNDRLLTCLDWTHPVTKDSVVLDLGSGHGGISHEVCIVSLCGVYMKCSFLLLLLMFLYNWIPCVGNCFMSSVVFFQKGRRYLSVSFKPLHDTVAIIY